MSEQKSFAEIIHREVMRDPMHAFRNVDIKKPDPWKGRTDLTL